MISLTGDAIADTQAWLEKAVIGLNLCPFAKAVHVKQQVRYVLSQAQQPDQLKQDLITELQLIAVSDPQRHDTTLLIHPFVLADFYDFNDFLRTAEQALKKTGLAGVIQIASFHPGYQFTDCGADDIENYTNRAPYPILHLLREDSIEKAVAAFPDASDIYERNIATLRKLGLEGWQNLFERA